MIPGSVRGSTVYLNISHISSQLDKEQSRFDGAIVIQAPPTQALLIRNIPWLESMCFWMLHEEDQHV